MQALGKCVADLQLCQFSCFFTMLQANIVMEMDKTEGTSATNSVAKHQHACQGQTHFCTESTTGQTEQENAPDRSNTSLSQRLCTQGQ